MSPANNQELVERFIEKVYNQGNIDVMTDFLIPDSMLAGGLSGQVMTMKMAFPDLHIAIDDLIVAGDKAALLVTIRGTQTGPLAGLPSFGKFPQPIPPSGKSATTTGILFFKLKDGKITSVATEVDMVAMLRQLGWKFEPPD